MTTAPSKPALRDQFPHSSVPKWGGTKSNLHHQSRRPPLHFSHTPPPRVSELGNRSDHAAARFSSDAVSNGGASRLGSRSSFVDATNYQRTAPKPEKVQGGDEVGGVGVEAAAVEVAEKQWNLRPRRVAVKTAIEIVVPGGGCVKRGEAAGEKVMEEGERKGKSVRLRSVVEGTGIERGKKQRFWISLSREEIEEDVYALTGGRPARRPRKRAKNVQKNLDVGDSNFDMNLFPGLWLAGVSPECYRALDTPVKGRHDHNDTSSNYRIFLLRLIVRTLDSDDILRFGYLLRVGAYASRRKYCNLAKVTWAMEHFSRYNWRISQDSMYRSITFAILKVYF
ncbi:hypothetical protein AKJ16_DCAP09843 [Drosera capensis]